MSNRQFCEILIIEDNPLDAELMIRALKQKHLANNLIHFQDGVEALDFLLHRGAHTDREGADSPKVVFLDIKLPKMDGLQILKEIRGSERSKHVPVVIITSSAEHPDVEKAYAEGANSYVVKPVDFAQFSHTVESLGLYWLLVNTPQL